MSRIVNPALMDRGVPMNGLLAPPNHLSFSQLTKLSKRYSRSCPRQWAYNRLMGLPYPAGNAMTLGKALDTAVESFFTLRKIGTPLVGAVSTSLPKIRETIESANWKDQAKPKSDYVSMMELAFEEFANEFSVTIPASTQRDHVYEVRSGDGTCRMVGYSDWIEQDGTIVDLKYTGASKWNASGEWYPDWVAQVRDQLCTYYMGRVYAERAGVIDATAPVIPRGRVVVVCAAINRKTPVVKSLDLEFDDELVSEIADAVREADAVRKGDKHPARPGDACQFCPYRARCQQDCEAFDVSTLQLAMAVPVAV